MQSLSFEILQKIIDEYRSKGHEFLFKVFNSSKCLEELSGISEMLSTQHEEVYFEFAKDINYDSSFPCVYLFCRFLNSMKIQTLTSPNKADCSNIFPILFLFPFGKIKDIHVFIDCLPNKMTLFICLFLYTILHKCVQ